MVEQFRPEHNRESPDTEPEDVEAGVEPEVPEVLPLLPLRGTVVFPMTLLPLAAGQPRSLRLIDDVISGDRLVGMVLQKNADLYRRLA